MNIIEAYIKFYGQLIIILSGIAGCGKNKFAKNISNTFGIKLIKQADYVKDGYTNTMKIGENLTVNNLNTDDAFDWNRLLSDINKYKSSGIIVTGISFPNKIININIDYHLHLSISKQECIERKQKFLENNKEKYTDEYAIINTPLEKLYMNKLIYPYYLDSIKQMRINKFIKGTGISDNIIWDRIWDVIIEFIQKSVDNFANSEKYVQWKRDNSN